MKLIMHKHDHLTEDRIEVYYKQMNYSVQAVVECIEHKCIHVAGILDGEKYALDINEIYYFDTVDKLNFAYLKEKIYKVTYILSEIEEQLKDYGFVRISKSVVVNIYKIDYMTNEINMKIKAHLENGEVLLVSRHYKKNFEEALQRIKTQLMGECK